MVPRALIGLYQTLTRLQSPEGETSTTVTFSSTLPRLPPQLAWVTRMTRSVRMSETTATWPLSMRPLGWNTSTEPVSGARPVRNLSTA
ncbi:hypothetical protein D3C85_821860 [compost metagenome]